MGRSLVLAFLAGVKDIERTTSSGRPAMLLPDAVSE
jgi:hypothetical protein